MQEHEWRGRYQARLVKRFGTELVEEGLQRCWEPYQESRDERILEEAFAFSVVLGLEGERSIPWKEQLRLRSRRLLRWLPGRRAMKAGESEDEDDRPAPNANRMRHDLAHCVFSGTRRPWSQRILEVGYGDQPPWSVAEEDQVLVGLCFHCCDGIRKDVAALYLRACVLEQGLLAPSDRFADRRALLTIYSIGRRRELYITHCKWLRLEEGILRGEFELEMKEGLALRLRESQWGAALVYDENELASIGVGVRVSIGERKDCGYELQLSACFDVPSGKRDIEQHRLLLFACGYAIPPDDRDRSKRDGTVT